MDLSKAFGTVDVNILLENLNMYEVKVNKWFHSYLPNWKLYIEFQLDCKKEKNKFIND